MDYINLNIVRGVNFVKISEVIVELNFWYFSRCGFIYNVVFEEGFVVGFFLDELEFYVDELYLFFGSDYIISIFLWDFEIKREIY